MDKEEILEKSRGDIHGMDERFMSDYQRMNTIALTVMMLVWLVLMIWDFLHDQNVYELNALMMSGLATMCFYRAYLLRSKAQFFFGFLIALGAASFAVSHIVATM